MILWRKPESCIRIVDDQSLRSAIGLLEVFPPIRLPSSQCEKMTSHGSYASNIAIQSHPQLPQLLFPIIPVLQQMLQAYVIASPDPRLTHLSMQHATAQS